MKTPILVCCVDEDQYDTIEWIQFVDDTDTFWNLNSNNLNHRRPNRWWPTHWQPLPEPPQEG